jgi:lipopolysaccharide/colanic/teichoic acid biosynthesis glycosyltransferase
MRADRSGGLLSSVIFEAGNSPGAEPTQPSLMRRVAGVILRASRATDAIGMLSPGQCHICAVLPDTSAGGAECFAQRVRTLALQRGIEIRATVYCYPADAANRRTHNGQDQDGGEQLRPNSRHGPPAREAALGQDHQNTAAHPAYAQTSPPAMDLRSSTAISRPNGVRTKIGDGPSCPNDVARRGDGVLPLADLISHRMPLWKRLFDIVGAIVGLILFSPVMVLAALLIRLSTNGPVIFTQRRTGWRGREFTIYKFRTMTTDAEQRKSTLRQFSEQDGPAFKMTNDPRVTAIGRFLRATSLDELPQFWNVLVGNMSLVGPRPLPVEEADACGQWHRRRLDVVPGLTCIWQVRGRSSVAFDDWMRMDMEYIDHRSPLRDLWILLVTIPAVTLRKGAH